MAKSFGHYLQDAGITDRSTVIVDKEGIIRYKRIYTEGIPDPAEILAEVEKLG